ncbi:MAG: DUF2314 domain-containing protein [Phycisphaerales bacterium]|nr:DUF2314 domain-containing protein [Phycisphaerae bacterium]NNF42067.1 DUF2314 domain-containing protein [Phycisphaerales bacterium]NNM25781.1 DUF2314 domain-containing protein [Phycisphaerales bacterium]
MTQAPTQLVLPWPGVAPDAAAVLFAIGAFAGQTPEDLGVVGEDDPEIAWGRALAIPAFPAPLVLWVEPAQPVDPRELPGVDLAGCEHVLCVQTLLGDTDPLATYALLMRMVEKAFETVPAVLDANTTRWFPRPTLAELFGVEAAPPPDVLWLIQLVESGTGQVWLHTHGLDRCAAPELEMLEVPVAFAAVAAELMDEVAAHRLDGPWPASGAPLSLGPDLAVTLVPAATVVPTLPAGTLGAAADRVGVAEAAHGLDGMVVCATTPSGPPARWTWPRDVLERWRRGTIAIERSPRVAAARRQMAQREWPRLCAMMRPDHELIVAAGVEIAETDGDREHLWFAVEDADTDGVEGRLLHTPAAAAGLAAGDRRRLARADITDWRVRGAEGSYGPGDLDRMQREATRGDAHVTG